MNFLNSDFETTESKAAGVEDLRKYYLSTVSVSTRSVISRASEEDVQSREYVIAHEYGKAGVFVTLFWNIIVLAERTTKNYSRNLLAYGVRTAMYGGVSGRTFAFSMLTG